MTERAKKYSAIITAVERFLPEKVLDNFDLEKIVATSNEWILERTGIRERRILEDEPTSFMAVEVARKILERRQLDPAEIDLIIVATITPDMFFPSTACLVQHRIGATNAWGYDLNAACSGFLYGVTTGSKFIESGAYKKVLVIGADKMSSIVDYTDRSTCIIFGDGAGAVLLETTEDGTGIQDSILRSDGSGEPFLHQKAGGSRRPPSQETLDSGEHYVHQEGKTVFKFAVSNMADVSFEIMERNNLSADDVAWLVPHQANLRIIDATAKRMGVGTDKVMINIDRYGNTTNGTIPICLSEWESKLNKGDNLILAAFGGGFTWGSVYLKWAYGPS